jgi:hypothetical protein
MSKGRQAHYFAGNDDTTKSLIRFTDLGKKKTYD